MSDPREGFGLTVEPEVVGPYSLVPSRHLSSSTGGLLDYGIAAFTKDGRRVVIGELFAAAIGAGGSKIRIDTKAVGQIIVDTLNNPAAVP